MQTTPSDTGTRVFCVRSIRGFTLVEVLVALAIVAVAFLAMYGSTQQIVNATTLQQERTFASWVAANQISELRLGSELPRGDRITDTAEMAGREWRFEIDLQELDSEYFKQAVVRVAPAEEPDNVVAQMLAVLPTRSAAAGGGNSGAALLSSAATEDGAAGGGDPGNDNGLIDTDGDGVPDSPAPGDTVNNAVPGSND